MKLSKDCIDIIRYRIDQSDVTMDTLRDDLLDHLCCVVEQKIDEGQSFEFALQEAFHELAPHGLDEIQRKTFYLLKSPKIIFMKKVMYLIGLITTISMSLGWTFRILNWPGGNELLTYGFLGFVLLFIPMVAVNYFKVNLHGALSEKLRIVLGVSSGIIVGLAIVLKFLHLPGADQLLFGGTLLFSFGFLPFLFFNMYKKAVS
jgi:hypothetical protein